MNFISGKLLTKNGFISGYFSYEKNRIIEYNKNKPRKKANYSGLIIPKIINSHTHIGDSFIKNRNINIPNDIEKLVAPPNGLKHKMLKEVDKDEVIEGMEKSIDIMINSGTNHFIDFRENGIMGIRLLKTSLKYRNINSVVLSRPNNLEYNKKEINELIKNSNGIGISSISDWDYSELIKLSKHVKKKKKLFSIHASERIREDIGLILDLKPNFIIHMLKGNESDLLKIKELDIPIVICPRSNNFFSLQPNYKLLKKIGIRLCIGTDNAMISTPNIIEEIKFIKKTTKVFSVEELLQMVTYEPRKVLNLDCNILGPNSKDGFVVLDKKTLNPLYVSR